MCRRKMGVDTHQTAGTGSCCHDTCKLLTQTQSDCQTVLYSFELLLFYIFVLELAILRDGEPKRSECSNSASRAGMSLACINHRRPLPHASPWPASQTPPQPRFLGRQTSFVRWASRHARITSGAGREAKSKFVRSLAALGSSAHGK